MSKIKLFTHIDLDGVGCAVLAYLAFGKENVDVDYCKYDDVDEKVEKFLSNTSERREYDMVYITDISVEDELAKAIDIYIPNDKVQLLDHHATALNLNKYDWCDVRVVMDIGLKTCGTELFYNWLDHSGYFDDAVFDFPESNLTRFVEIVRDYDTWRWKELGDEGLVCKQINDLLYIYGRDEFIQYIIDSLYFDKDDEFPLILGTPLALLEQKQKDIDRYVEKKDKQLMVNTDQFGYAYGVVFAEQYFSELGNRLCELHPELVYIAMIDISSGQVSYRSISDDIDLGGTIAHSLGGGGHKKAAGSMFDGKSIRDSVIKQVFDMKEIL